MRTPWKKKALPIDHGHLARNCSIKIITPAVKALVIFISRVGIPVAMCLFIDCHILFEVQLLCLNLHIEVLSFEDSEWSHGHWKMECQVEKLKHFGHKSAGGHMCISMCSSSNGS